MFIRSMAKVGNIVCLSGAWPKYAILSVYQEHGQSRQYCVFTVFIRSMAKVGNMSCVYCVHQEHGQSR